MEVQNAGFPLEHVLAGIDALDLEMIKFKVTCKEDGYGWSREHADRIEVGYKRFLKLLAKYPERAIAPTRDIDDFWHAHILDTRKYADDCMRVFGEFVHHYPYLGLGENEQDAHVEAFDAMNELYASEFGEELPMDASAYCFREPKKADAAYCFREPKKADAAYCFREPKKADAAYCFREPKKADAAYCFREPKKADAAYCFREPKKADAAYCFREPKKADAAYCFREPKKADVAAAVA
ncbi:glycine-rich domain-containing protein-like, partial [Aquabacterium sp. A7-Y]|uniref:glycine-rich domain-containing protein n=1 Tax=Aquabacterium sp. A7-Y TaxID=1349605 RepID=UPI00223DBF5F